MSQTNFVLVMLFVAFLVFITARNELLTYVDLILPGRGPVDSNTGTTPASQTGAAGLLAGPV